MVSESLEGSNMLQPELSLLIGIDAPLRDPIPAAVSMTDALFKVATSLTVPVLIAAYPQSLEPGIIVTCCPEASRYQRLPFEPATSPWTSTVLASEIFASSRRQLIVCGFWLEEAVTLFVLQTLYAGLDVYVSSDATGAIVHDQQSTLLSRLVQHNAVVTTTEQVLREWGALTTDERKRSALAPFLK